jgi:NAD(P)-dependent dehydrogenase (short-subunit alcohol dehydrogenase family)
LLTRNVAAEMGAFAIRVNCIHPGLIETPMIEWVLNHPDPSVQTGVVAQISLGRTGQPCEIGAVAAFFCLGRGPVRYRSVAVRRWRPGRQIVWNGEESCIHHNPA